MLWDPVKCHAEVQVGDISWFFFLYWCYYSVIEYNQIGQADLPVNLCLLLASPLCFTCALRALPRGSCKMIHLSWFSILVSSAMCRTWGKVGGGNIFMSVFCHYILQKTLILLEFVMNYCCFSTKLALGSADWKMLLYIALEIPSAHKVKSKYQDFLFSSCESWKNLTELWILEEFVTWHHIFVSLKYFLPNFSEPWEKYGTVVEKLFLGLLLLCHNRRFWDWMNICRN